MKKQMPKAGHIVVTLRLTEAVHAELVLQAKADDRSFQYIANKILTAATKPTDVSIN